MSCPICGKRPPKRYCPAKGEKICAVCCGREREVTIDCPVDCPHLLAAHRYEKEHRKPIPPEQFPYPDVEFSVHFVQEHWHIVAGFAATILGFQLQNKELNDSDSLGALEALAETFRTLGTGIYYEKPPAAPLPRALYGHLATFIQDFKKQDAGRAGFSTVKDSEIFHLLIFLLRVGKQESNGRPRTRTFLGFLRTQFPLPAEAEKEAPRIIMP